MLVGAHLQKKNCGGWWGWSSGEAHG